MHFANTYRKKKKVLKHIPENKTHLKLLVQQFVSSYHFPNPLKDMSKIHGLEDQKTILI